MADPASVEEHPPLWTLEGGIERLVNLYCFHGLLDEEPREFANWWVRQTTSAEWANMVELGKSPSTYEVYPTLHISPFSCCEALIDAGAEQNPGMIFQTFADLLPDPVGRQMGIYGLDRAVHRASRSEAPDAPDLLRRVHAFLEENARHLIDLDPLERELLHEIACEFDPDWSRAFMSRLDP